MGRFSPDTWLDAVQLPFAMVQFKGSVYVEPIAPDLRPAACIILVVVACLVSLVKKWRRTDALSDELAIRPNTRAAWALITASLLTLVAWIATSANGRYGLLALTLSPLAGLAALLIATKSKRVWFVVLGIIVSIQALFLLTADPDDTWSKLTRYQWKEAHADLLPAQVIAPWRSAAHTHSLLVVTAKTLTGMSTLYQVFGPEARYMGLGYLDQYPMESGEHERAIQMAQTADVIYLSRAVASNPRFKDGVKSISNPISDGEIKRLHRFGLSALEGVRCVLLPERMGAQLQICPLIKVAPERIPLNALLPELPLRILKSLERKCPRIFGEFIQPLSDDEGGIFTSMHDGKYFLEILKNLDVYIRHRGEHEHRLIISGSNLQNLNLHSCEYIIGSGMQYWR